MQVDVNTLSNLALDIIRDRIISGTLPVNVQMGQTFLAAELGISTIPVREVLGRLEQEG